MSGSRRLLAFLSVALVVDTAAYAVITPLLPGLTEEHDLSKSGAGVLSASYAAGTFAASLPAAWIAARIGAKRTVLAAMSVLAVASLGFALASSAAGLIAARLLQGIGAAAVWAGALSWVVAVAPRERRAEAIGTAVGAAIAGAVGGPVLGTAADEVGTGAVFGAFVALPLAMIVIGSRFPAPPIVALPGVSALRAALSEPRMRRGMWCMALPAIGFGLIGVLVPLRLDELGAGAVTIGATFLAAVVFEALMSPFVGRLADRRGALWPARIGLVAGGSAVALLPVPGVVVLLSLGVMVAAPLLGMLWAPAMAMLTEGAEARGIDPAFGFGLANLAWGAGATVGGSGGGALADATVDLIPYLLVAAAAVVTAAALRPRAVVVSP